MSTRAQLPPRDFDPSDHALLVGTVKALSIDAVEQAKSGHPGLPLGAADLAVTLWTRFLVHDPTAPHWIDRDRFVLSAGHGSMLLYSLLHLTGYGLTLSDLQAFRQYGSKTPGHPEFGHTDGVEVTTGPLGTGFATGVGLALAERFLAARYNRPGHEIIDHFTYGIVSDGDLQEGVAFEAASVAGHQGLGKLVYLYDSNGISIDGPTTLSFTENAALRFEALGWHVQSIDGHDPAAIADALTVARGVQDKPSLIVARTVIGKGSPGKQGTSAVHGSPLGPAEAEATKRAIGWPLEPKFYVPDEVRTRLARLGTTTAELHREWQARWDAYEAAHPALAAELQTVLRGDLPPGTLAALPTFAIGSSLATRKSNLQVMKAISAVHPTIIGGSADLTESNGVGLADETATSREHPEGRYIHFGVREHGMAAIVNGLALHGGVRPFGSTFLVFSDFLRGALRLAALQRLPLVHVLSHDSIFLGEDGPTHQPIEQAMALRLIPGLFVVRPADAKETVGAWRLALSHKIGDGPVVILVTRQPLPTLAESRDDISQGGYVLWDPPDTAVADLHGILIATGSEVPLALEVSKRLATLGKAVRVVSIPCWLAFEQTSAEYRESVLPAAIERRLSVEAGTPIGWARYARDQHGIETFGLSAPAERLAEHFGFTPEAVLAHYLDLP